jgi:hypothetical protein
MKSSWQAEKGHLTRRWSEVGPPVPYNLDWMHETSDIPSGYLPSLPDFASHSPFGGAFWFEPHTADRASK